MKITQKYLSEKLTQELRNQSETGMGFQICTVILKDGRSFERVLILDASEIATADGETDLPFQANQIQSIVVTHDKSI